MTTYHDRFADACAQRGVTMYPTVPTRWAAVADAKRDIIARLAPALAEGAPLTQVQRVGLDYLAEEAASASAADRHEARVLACETALRQAAAAAISVLDEDAEQTTDDDRGRVTAVVAMVLGLIAIRGSGGPDDTGGPAGASALPILPWIRSRAWTGNAWIAALRAAVRRLYESWAQGGAQPIVYKIYLVVDDSADVGIGWTYVDGGAVSMSVYRIDRGLIHPEIWRLIDFPAGSAVDGEAMPIQVEVPGHPCDTSPDASVSHPLDVAGAVAIGRAGLVWAVDM